MPYINNRDKFKYIFRELPEIETAGELNYLITMISIEYTKKKGLKYQTINDVVGALIGAKDEFNRRVTSKYENIKIQENGDVYPESWAK